MVRRLWTPDGACDGLRARSTASRARSSGSEAAGPSAVRLLRDAALCNDATLAPGSPRSDLACRGRSLRRGAARGGGQAGPDHRAVVSADWTGVEETPFDSDRWLRGTVHRAPRRASARGGQGRSGDVLALLRARPGRRRGSGRGRRLAGAGLPGPGRRRGPGLGRPGRRRRPTAPRGRRRGGPRAGRRHPDRPDHRRPPRHRPGRGRPGRHPRGAERLRRRRRRAR